MPTKKHAYVELPPSKNCASQGKNVRTNTHNSAFQRTLLTHQLKNVFWVLKRTVSMSWDGRDQNFYTYLVALRRTRLMRKHNVAYLLGLEVLFFCLNYHLRPYYMYVSICSDETERSIFTHFYKMAHISQY